MLFFSLLSATFAKCFTGFIVLLLCALQNGLPEKDVGGCYVIFAPAGGSLGLHFT